MGEYISFRVKGADIAFSVHEHNWLSDGIVEIIFNHPAPTMKIGVMHEMFPVLNSNLRFAVLDSSKGDTYDGYSTITRYRVVLHTEDKLHEAYLKKGARWKTIKHGG